MNYSLIIVDLWYEKLIGLKERIVQSVELHWNSGNFYLPAFREINLHFAFNILNIEKTKRIVKHVQPNYWKCQTSKTKSNKKIQKLVYSNLRIFVI